MYNNIGGKIKGLAWVIFSLGIVPSLLLSLNVFHVLQGEVSEFLRIIAVFVSFIFCLLILWVSTFLIYGFGELIENTSEIRRKLSTSKEHRHLQPQMENSPYGMRSQHTYNQRR